MAYYVTNQVQGPVLSARRPTINELFLSSYTMAVYDGCEFGCPYCDSWAYRTRALNETIQVSLDLPARLEQELAQVSRQDLIGITALSDPYQPAETTYRLTREVLKVLRDRAQPCLIMTKSPLILDDLPLLRQMNERSLVIVVITLVSENAYIADKLEGKPAPPQLRLEIVRELKRAGIATGVAMIPIIPFVNDTVGQQSNLLHAVAKVGTDFLVWDYLVLPNDRMRSRMAETLARVGSFPNSYYRDLYGQNLLPQAIYRTTVDRELLNRCDGLTLDVRAPTRIFQQWLRPENTAALLLKHTAFRDATQGRELIARQHRQLADQIYRGEASAAQLQESPLWPQLQTILSATEEKNQSTER